MSNLFFEFNFNRTHWYSYTFQPKNENIYLLTINYNIYINNIIHICVLKWKNITELFVIDIIWLKLAHYYIKSNK